MKKPVKILLILLLLGALTGIVIYAMKRSAKKQLDAQVGKSIPEQGDYSTSNIPTPPAPGVSLSNPPAQNNAPSGGGGYTLSQLQAFVPDSIKDATNALSADQWNSIVAAANACPPDKFASLKAQLDDLSWFQAKAINLLSPDTLYKGIISKLQA